MENLQVICWAVLVLFCQTAFMRKEIFTQGKYKPHYRRTMRTEGWNSLTNFTVNFTSFELEKSHFCKADSFEIWDSLETERLIEPLCANLSLPQVFYFVDYGLVFKFKSDQSYEYSGFHFEVTDDEPLDVAQVCESMRVENGTKIRSGVKGYPNKYPASLSCEWELSVPSGQFVQIDFENVDIEFSGPECVKDRLEIWEKKQDDGDYSMVDKYCGRYRPWKFIALSSQVLLKFVSDAENNNVGFNVSYSASDNPRQYRAAMFYRRASLLPQTFSVDKNERYPIQQIRTNPGFAIVVKTDKPSPAAITFHDGPDMRFPRLEPLSIVRSNGFYVTLVLSLSEVDSPITVTFYAESDLLPEKMGVIQKGGQNFYVNSTKANTVHYYSIRVREDRFPGVLISLSSDLMKVNPNTRQCEETGIALYAKSTDFNNMVGPFCDITPGHTNEALSKTLAQSDFLYAVIYDYAQMAKRWENGWLEVTASRCPGFQLLDETFRTGIHESREEFEMTARLTDNTKTIQISLGQNFADCYLISIFSDAKDPPFSNHLPLLVTVAAPQVHQFRLCRGGNCSTHKTYPAEPPQVVPAAPSDTWSAELLWLEIGLVTENDCGVVPKSENGGGSTKILRQNCGTILQSKPKDTWVLQPTANVSGFWEFELSRLYTDSVTVDAILTIKENDELTKISYFRIGEGRTFKYITREDVKVEISTQNVGQIVLSFDFFTSEPAVNFSGNCGNYTEAISYLGHCYLMLALEEDSWMDAKERCPDDWHLLSINSMDELGFVKSAYKHVWHPAMKKINVIVLGLTDNVKAGDHIWEDGSLLSVSDWYTPFAPFDHILSERINKFDTMNTSKIQPLTDTSQRCTIMTVGNPNYSTNWAKFSCERKQLPKDISGVICEKGNNTLDTVQYFKDNAPNLTTLSCPDGWNVVENECLSVLTADKPPTESLDYDTAKQLCENHRGEVAEIKNFPLSPLQHFFASLNLGRVQGGFWFSLNASHHGCLFSPLDLSNEMLNERIRSSRCNTNEGKPSHVICETPQILKPYGCDGYQFSCNDGVCLTPDLVCDGQPDCPMGEDEFDCSSSKNRSCRVRKELFSVFKFCDVMQDCWDMSDELYCVHPNKSSDQWKCADKLLIQNQNRCDMIEQCVDGSDEKKCDWGTQCKDFRCPLVGCVANDLVNDLHPDCPDTTEMDERQNLGDGRKTHPYFYQDKDRKRIKVNRVINECPGFVDKQRCDLDQPKCYLRHRNCILERNNYGKMKQCRNGAHLRHCETFKCPGLFKCHKSYCIRPHQVCDGVNDCANGEDEAYCTNYVCPFQLRCGRSSQCVSQEFVCDGIVHCKEGRSDERFCDLKNSACPDGCICFGYYMSCVESSRNSIPEIKFRSHLRILNFTRNFLKLSNETLRGFQYLAYLYLRENKIRQLQPETFAHCPNLFELDLRDNELTTLEAGTFKGLGNLELLWLLGNRIRSVSDRSFEGLPRIDNLNLSGMAIVQLSKESFYGLDKVHTLDISNNKIEFIENGTFSMKELKTVNLIRNSLDSTGKDTVEYLSIERLTTSSYRFCCYAKKIQECEPQTNAYSSCKDLLANNLLRAVIWVLGLLAFLCNGVVIVWRIYDRVSNVPSVLILNLAIADCIMGCYLLSICLADISYREEYSLKDVEWRRSGFCGFLGVVATIAIEMSFFTLVAIAIDRTKRIGFASSSNQMTKQQAWSISICGWVISGFIALFPVALQSQFGHFYGRNSICLPFNFSDENAEGWEYGTAIFVVLNSVALLVMIAMYIVIICRGKEAKEADARTDSVELNLARNLSLTIISNIMCHVPLIIANVSAIIGNPVSQEMASLLTAVMLPLNAMLNPIIFILSTVRSIRVAKYLAKEKAKSLAKSSDPNQKPASSLTKSTPVSPETSQST